MTGQLRLSETQLSDFRSIVGLSKEQLRAILDRLNELSPAPMSQMEVRRVVGEVLREEQEKGEAVTRQALALAGLQYRHSIPHDELVQVLGRSLDGKLSREEMEAWGFIAPLFQEMLGSRAIRTIVKSLELLYDYANLIQSTNVITDLRPVYDDEAEHAIGAIVSFTLRLSYMNGDTVHSLSLAMDAEDVNRLQAQCKRALKKAESAQIQFSGQDGSEPRIKISGKDEQ
ncbi:MAG: hypothetical protein ACYC61_25350 [Isosphaeraceae bacterium]